MSGIHWLSHRHLRIDCDNINEIPDPELYHIANSNGKSAMCFYSGLYSTTVVIDPVTFKPMRTYTLRMINPKCVDNCCMMYYDMKVAIEA